MKTPVYVLRSVAGHAFGRTIPEQYGDGRAARYGRSGHAVALQVIHNEQLPAVPISGPGRAIVADLFVHNAAINWMGFLICLVIAYGGASV